MVAINLQLGVIQPTCTINYHQSVIKWTNFSTVLTIGDEMRRRAKKES